LSDGVEQILADGYLGDLPSRSMDDVHRMRDACRAVEVGVSYLRRLVQGRLDIVTNERRRRATMGAGLPTSDVVAALPRILADRSRPPGSGRPPQSLLPADPAAVTEVLEVVSPAGELAALPELSDQEVTALAERLGDLERRVSDQRREIFSRLDALQAELARRYRTGEATVDSLLG
jgi:hypothetical protein